MPTKHKGPEAERVVLDAFIKFTRAAAALDNAMSRKIREHGLTAPQFAVLECVYHLEPIQQSEISNKILTSGGNVTLVLDNLEKQGFITRVVNPADRRCIKVHITTTGRAWMNEYFPEHVQFIMEKFNVLTKNEISELGAICRKLGIAAKT